MGAITGVNVRVNGAPTLGHFNLNLFSSSKTGEIIASNTKGAAARVQGNIGFRGYFWAWGYKAPAGPVLTKDGWTNKTGSLWVNDCFTFQGTLNGGDEVYSPANGARVIGVQVVVPVGAPQNERYVYYVVHFASAYNGAGLQFGNGTPPAYPDSANPSMYCASGLGVVLGTTVVPSIEYMEFTAKSLAEPYVNSSTNGFLYWPVGNLDWTMMYRQNPATLNPADADLTPAIDSIQEVGMQVTLASGTTLAKQWSLGYGIFSEPIKITAVVGEKKVLVNEIEANMTAWSGSAYGVIEEPDGGTLWP